MSKIKFRLVREYEVEIDPSDIGRHRKALEVDYPDGDWSEDESVINAIVADFEHSGANGELVAFGSTKVHRIYDKAPRRRRR